MKIWETQAVTNNNKEIVIKYHIHVSEVRIIERR